MYNPLSDIRQYNTNLTMSQLIKLFDKKGVNVTRAMVQNYIRDGLLPPPVNKRFYTHRHAAALVIIDYLKSVFEISDIKAALAPLTDAEGLPLDVYEKIIGQSVEILAEWQKRIAGLCAKTPPLTRLLTMAHAADIAAASLGKGNEDGYGFSD